MSAEQQRRATREPREPRRNISLLPTRDGNPRNNDPPPIALRVPVERVYPLALRCGTVSIAARTLFTDSAVLSYYAGLLLPDQRTKLQSSEPGARRRIRPAAACRGATSIAAILTRRNADQECSIFRGSPRGNFGSRVVPRIFPGEPGLDICGWVPVRGWPNDGNKEIVAWSHYANVRPAVSGGFRKLGHAFGN